MNSYRRLLICTCAVVTVLFVTRAAAQRQFSQAGAQEIINTKDWNRLLAYGKAWAEAEPRNATAWYVIARAYGSKDYNIGLGQPTDAATAYRKVVQLNPQWAEAWNALGITDLEIGQWQEAANALEHATQISPQRTTYWDFLCAAYMHTHQFEQAAHAADNMERYATGMKDWFQAGACYSSVGPYYEPTAMYQKSKAAFLKVVQLDPRNGPAWTNLGTMEQALGNTKDAFADYQKGAQFGDKQGEINNENLAADIQACMIQRNAFKQPGTYLGAAIVSYNQKCARYTGEIKLIYRP